MIATVYPQVRMSSRINRVCAYHKMKWGFIFQAKLGDANRFYYDEKLKKWVEEGVDPTPDIAPPPPPPTMSSFVGVSTPLDETHATPQAVTLKPGTPPLAPNSINHFSNRRQSGVRSRYVHEIYSLHFKHMVTVGSVGT